MVIKFFNQTLVNFLILAPLNLFSFDKLFTRNGYCEWTSNLRLLFLLINAEFHINLISKLFTHSH
jgi:hypothetical protein